MYLTSRIARENKVAVRAIHNDISPFLFVIPGLTRNPVPSWIPAFAGMTECAVINVAVYSKSILMPDPIFWTPSFASFEMGELVLQRRIFVKLTIPF